MSDHWAHNPHRTETFVFKFKDQESFQKFYKQYCSTMIDNTQMEKEGVFCSHAATGDRMKILDKCQELLYSVAEQFDKTCQFEWAEKCENLEKK